MENSLKKELTLLDVFCVATGAMISSGLFILPGLAFSKAGPAVILTPDSSRFWPADKNESGRDQESF